MSVVHLTFMPVRLVVLHLTFNSNIKRIVKIICQHRAEKEAEGFHLNKQLAGPDCSSPDKHLKAFFNEIYFWRGDTELQSFISLKSIKGVPKL